MTYLVDIILIALGAALTVQPGPQDRLESGQFHRLPGCGDIFCQVEP